MKGTSSAHWTIKPCILRHSSSDRSVGASSCAEPYTSGVQRGLDLGRVDVYLRLIDVCIIHVIKKKKRSSVHNRGCPSRAATGA